MRLSYQGESLLVRRIVLHLKKPTRNGKQEITIFTMLDEDVASAAVVVELYRGRRSVVDQIQATYRARLLSQGKKTP